MTDASPAPVLFVHSGRDWIRGSERCLLDLIARVDRRRFAPVLLCDAPTLAREAASLGAAVERVEGWVASWRPPAAQVRRVGDVVRAHGVRLVHANNLIPLPSVVPVARRRAIPTVAHVHLMVTRAERLHSWLHQAGAVVGVARHVVAGALEDGVRPDRVHVIYNGVDRGRLDAGDARGLRAALGIRPEAFVAAVVGSLIAIKGQGVILDALASLRAESVDAHLLVLGEGEDRPALETRVRELGLAGRVAFLGERDDVGAVLRDAADVAVTASRMEAFPLNVLEAQYARVPVVASDIAAHAEAVVDGRTGLLFRTGDAPSLAAALGALARDPARRRAFGAAGHARVVADLTVERYVRDFEALYDALLAAPAAAHGWRGSAWPSAYGAWVGEAVRRRLRRSPTR